ncbi:MAG TPA: rhamnan synthesis F family protein, partial [Terriglobia bacterium]|nr:rhamnan synthesis F family protein [Terriglobia bacterium]
IVSHEATATGAPVLSLNIIWELKKRYNVVSLLLAGGSVFNDFANSADVCVGPVFQHGEFVCRHQIDRLLALCKFKFAIVNSAASRIALYELAKHFVPSVVLIHEFAVSLRPRNAMQETVFWASQAIFSADIVRENAAAAYPDLLNRLPEVIPQGKCSYLPSIVDDSSPELAAIQIGRTLRPAGWPDDTPVVIGVGSIQIRKGIDLFVSCAARVAQSIRCRFVWIGAGYEPDTDTLYSLYLEDQVQRAGLSDSFTFMNETSRIDVAYDKADLLVLSSRLDPLPNVCIDAMSRGLPFVCFDRTTGIADLLRKNGLESECIAPYLDVERLSLLALSFLKSPELRKDVGRRLQEIAQRTFDMTSYVDRVEKIALSWSDRAAQEGADCATVAENSQLDFGYMAGPMKSMPARSDLIRAFVRSWASGYSLRKPFPGFHPGIYLEKCGIPGLDCDPLAHYVRAGSPAGPWSYEVLGPSSRSNEIPVPTSSSVALHLHVFYPDLAPIIMERLNDNRVRPDLFISVPSEAVRKEIEYVARVYKGLTIQIQVVPNRGRDIGPLLTTFGPRLIEKYEYIGHFHTKKTADLADSSAGEIWFSFLLENLIGGIGRMADVILNRMAEDRTIGIVFPDDPHAIGWSGNHESACRLAVRMGLRQPTESHFNFPVGTMFWARSAALRPLFELNLDWSDYPSEPLPYDGSMLHAIERLIPFVSEAAGFRAVTTRVPGVIR